MNNSMLEAAVFLHKLLKDSDYKVLSITFRSHDAVLTFDRVKVFYDYNADWFYIVKNGDMKLIENLEDYLATVL